MHNQSLQQTIDPVATLAAAKPAPASIAAEPRRYVSSRAVLAFLSLSAVALRSAGCATSSPKSHERLEVVDFAQGKMTRTSEGEWEIYEQAEVLTFGVNGDCVFDGKPKKCMWHGYRFSYRLAQPKAILWCETTSSAPQNFGNPNELMSQGANVFRYPLELSDQKTEFVNPQYIVAGQGSAQQISYRTICKFGGVEKLRFENTIVFPEAGKLET